MKPIILDYTILISLLDKDAKCYSLRMCCNNKTNTRIQNYPDTDEIV
jgi:hypothetical protein